MRLFHLPVLVLLLAVSLPGCSGPATVARKTLSAVNQAQMAASDEFERFDQGRELAIVRDGIKAGREVAAIRAELVEWRARSDRVEAGLRALASATRSARVMVDLAETARLDLAQVMAGVFAALRAAMEVASAAGLEMPGLVQMLAGGRP